MNSQFTHLLTKDGSSTLYSTRFDEHYHSLHGAIQESEHVFIQMGLRPLLLEKEHLSILEIGLGTGLNALLTLLRAPEQHIYYNGIEAYPLEKEAIAQLNYDQQLSGIAIHKLLEKIHSCPWNMDVEIHPAFTLHKSKVQLEDFQSKRKFDLIYFDAFAPNTQPELWTTDIFSKIFTYSEPGAIFVTYSSKGAVRRALISAGFEVEKIPGPPGKREMLRAKRPLEVNPTNSSLG